MKKVKSFILATLIIAMISITGYSQEKFNASISMGKVFPVGKFSVTDITSKQSGYAQSGFTLNIDGDYYLHNRIAVSLRFNFGNAPINQSEFKKYLVDKLSDYIKETDTAQYNINYWQWASPMIGLKYNYPIIINKFYFEAGLFSGISLVQIPDQNLYFNDNINKRIVVSQNVGKTDITIPLAINSGLRYRINPKMQFKLNVEFFATKSSIEHVSYYVNEKSTAQIEIEKYTSNVPIQTLNLSAGLVYNF